MVFYAVCDEGLVAAIPVEGNMGLIWMQSI